MNRHEAHTLICAAQSGNTSARNTLIEYYSDTLVPALAVSWGRLGYEDACSIGNLATVEAVDAAILSYDVSSSAGIASYVKRAITRALSQADYQALAIHAPAKIGKRSDDVPRARLTLAVEIPESAPNPEQSAIESETRKRLQTAIDQQLSPKHAAMIKALYFVDMDAPAVAAMFDCTVGHVDYVRSAALRVLRNVPGVADLLR